MGRSAIDITGQRFGRLIALEHLFNTPHWRCRCDCGKDARVSGWALRHNKIKSCGCLGTELKRLGRPKHGGVGTREYDAWRGAKARCTQTADEHWPDYGGRGIRVADEWEDDFAAFLLYIGPCPSPAHTLDRIDTNGHYEPGNVRWATIWQQANNRRNNRRVEWNGTTRTVAEWAAVVNIPAPILYHRIARHWPVHEAFTVRPNTGRRLVPRRKTTEQKAKISAGLRAYWHRRKAG